MSAKVWFGTREYMQWVPAWLSAPAYGSSGFHAANKYMNGGWDARNSATTHKSFNLAWAPMKRAEIQKITNYADGVYGDGLIFWSDPTWQDQNVLNTRFSVPWLGAKDQLPLVYGQRPQKVLNGDTSRGYPAYMAQYNITADADCAKFWLPIPPGYEAWVGVHGDPDSSGFVEVTPDGGAPKVVPTLGVDTAQRFSDAFAGTGLEIGLSKQGVGAINLATNPGFETAASGSTVVRRNQALDPSFQNGIVGWIANNAAAVGSHDTTFGRTGGRSLKITNVTDAPVGLQANGNGARVASVPGVSYTESIYVYSPVEVSVTPVIRWRVDTGAGSEVSVTHGATFVVPANTWTRVWVAGVCPAGAAGRFMGVIQRAATPSGYSWWLDDWLSEAASALGPYFDGNTPDALGIDYGWEGAVNESASTAKAGTVEVRRNFHVNAGAVNANGFTNYNGGGGNASAAAATAVTWATSGSAYRATWTTVASSSGDLGTVVAQGMDAAGAGATVTAVVRWRVNSARSIDGPILFSSTGGAGAFTMTARSRTTSIAAQPGVTYTDWVTFTVGTGYEASTRLVTQARPAAANDWIEVSEADIYLGGYDAARPWVWGGLPAAGDFTSAFAGTANNSASLQRGVGVASESAAIGTTLDRAARIQSTEWVKSGTKSIRVIPKLPNSYAEMQVGGLDVGQAYTLVATVRRATPGSGTADAKARQFWVVGGGDPPVTMITTPPNAAGEYEMRGVFVATNGGHSIRIMNGYSVGDCWFDDFAAVPCASIDQPYMGPPFDGNTPGAVWNGTPDASTSTRNEVTLTLAGVMVQVLPSGSTPKNGDFIAGQGHSGCKWDGEDRYTVTPYSVPNDAVGASAKLREAGTWQ